MRHSIFDVKIADLMLYNRSETVSGTTSMKIKALIKQSPGPNGPGLLRGGLL